ncbi:MAG: ABC transporter ATP-binding protein [Bacteroidetes bacterium]|nr:ABC transporter ATP-binding protein [Bacteroidota bacterium]
MAESHESLLACHDLHCSYPDGTVALDGVDLTIHAGERVALIGPNGAGKSTLLRAIIGLIPSDGDIIVGGTKLTGRTVRDIRQRIGLVFQNPDDQLFSPTVEEDVAFGPAALGCSRDNVVERTHRALDAVGMRDQAHRNPLQLSYGERRRAAIATVLSMRPAILAMDEPSSNLDPAHRRDLIRWIQQEEGCTLLLATHDLDMVAETCDRVLLLSRHIVADGATRTILTDNTLLAAYGLEAPLGLQQLRFRADP